MSPSQTIPELVKTLVDRAGIRFIDMPELMSNYWKEDYSEDIFKHKFRRGTSAKYEVRELVAFIHAVVSDIPQGQRCTAEEAFQLFDLAQIPPSQFKQLIGFFPEKEYRAAWKPYIQTYLSNETTDKETNFLKPPPPTLVLGREQDITNIVERLGAGTAKSRQPVNVIRGWPGVGKTTVINHLIHKAETELQAVFPDGVLWTSLGPDGDVVRSIKRWARQIGAIHLEELQRVDDIVEEMRYVLQDRTVLLVVDDVWDEAQGNRFKRLIGNKTTVLFATRFTALAHRVVENPSDVYLLDVLNTEYSLALLHSVAGEAADAYSSQMVALAETLEGLPLALRVAGNLIREEHFLGFDISPLIDDLQTSFGHFKHKAPADRIDETTGQSPTIGMLFRRSLQTLTPQDQMAFACVGGFAPKPATFDLRAIGHICELENPLDTARTLVGRGLLEPLGNERFQMHYTLSMYARHLLDTNLEELSS